MKSNVLIILLLSAITLSAEDSLEFHMEIRSSWFTTDQYMNMYIINEKNEIIKYNFRTKDSLTYSNKQLGTPSLIDAGNPLKIMVLYPDFNAIVLLDNQLSQIALFQLNTLSAGNIYKPLAACREEDGDMIWIYDELSQSLIGLNEQEEKLYTSESFDMLFSETVIPTRLLFSDQKLYLAGEDGDIYIFDRFANFDARLDLHKKILQQVVQSKLIFLEGNELSVLDMSAYTPTNKVLPWEHILQVNIQGDYLFIRTANAIFIYTN